jgi:hypothetical protein
VPHLSRLMAAYGIVCRRPKHGMALRNATKEGQSQLRKKRSLLPGATLGLPIPQRSSSTVGSCSRRRRAEPRAGYVGLKRKKGTKVHIAVDTLGNRSLSESRPPMSRNAVRCRPWPRRSASDKSDGGTGVCRSAVNSETGDRRVYVVATCTEQFTRLISVGTLGPSRTPTPVE